MAPPDKVGAGGRAREEERLGVQDARLKGRKTRDRVRAREYMLRCSGGSGHGCFIGILCGGCDDVFVAGL